MGKLRMLWARVKGQAEQGREDEAFDEEVREHIALLEQRYRAQGMSARDAARAARRQFGNVTVLKEKQRAQRGILRRRSGGGMCDLERGCWPSGPYRARRWWWRWRWGSA